MYYSDGSYEEDTYINGIKQNKPTKYNLNNNVE